MVYIAGLWWIQFMNCMNIDIYVYIYMNLHSLTSRTHSQILVSIHEFQWCYGIFVSCSVGSFTQAGNCNPIRTVVTQSFLQNLGLPSSFIVLLHQETPIVTMWWTSGDIHQVLCAHFRYREACCAMVHIEKSPASKIESQPLQS
jgi:hypothetical protein